MHNPYYRSLRLLQLESVATAMVFAMPILTIYFKDEIGMSLAQVGLSQAAFTIPLLLLNVVSGWIADTFSRRWCNFFGDALEVVGFLVYACATSFWQIVGAEVLLGIGVACSTGADTALFKAYTDRLKISYERVSAQTNEWRTLGEMCAVGVGGVVGAYNPRLAIGLSAASCAVGAVLSYLVIEDGERRARPKGTFVAILRHAVADMVRITRYSLHGHAPLAWRVIGYAVGRNVTHALIWMLTPLLVLAGVPAQIIGIGWMLNLAAVWLGSRVARRASLALTDAQRYGVALVVFVIAAGGLSINVSLVTIGLYAGYGFIRGWIASVMPPMVQMHTPADMQSTVMSVSGTIGNLIYIPLVWGFSALGDWSPQWSVLANLVLFAPIMMLITRKLSINERK